MPVGALQHARQWNQAAQLGDEKTAESAEHDGKKKERRYLQPCNLEHQQSKIGEVVDSRRDWIQTF